LTNRAGGNAPSLRGGGVWGNPAVIRRFLLFSGDDDSVIVLEYNSAITTI
jgi:hypothetical protein